MKFGENFKHSLAFSAPLQIMQYDIKTKINLFACVSCQLRRWHLQIHGRGDADLSVLIC